MPTHRCPAARQIGNVINADLVNNVSETWKLCNSPDVDTYALNMIVHVYKSRGTDTLLAPEVHREAQC